MAEKLLPHAEGREEAAALAMDRADAVAAIPARQAESVALYAAVAGKYPKDPLAPQALYLAGLRGDDPGRFRRHAASIPMPSWPPIRPTNWCPTCATWRRRAGCNWASTTRRKSSTPTCCRSIRNTPTPKAGRSARARHCNCKRSIPRLSRCLQPQVAQIKNADARAEAFFLIGSSQAEQKQFAEAVPSLEAALAASPRWRQADETLLVLGQAYYRQKNPAKAAETCRNWLPTSPRARSSIGPISASGNTRRRPTIPKRPRPSFAWSWKNGPQVPWCPMPCAGWAGRFSIRKNLPTAEEAFNTLVEKYPDSG